MFDTLDVSSSALTAQRVRMDTIANNLANANTTRDEHGNIAPYKRRYPIFRLGVEKKEAPWSERQQWAERGVSIKEIKLDDSAPRLVPDPDHPDADAEGYVKMPNIMPVVEMVNFIEASRAYEANITVMDGTKRIIADALRILG